MGRWFAGCCRIQAFAGVFRKSIKRGCDIKIDARKLHARMYVMRKSMFIAIVEFALFVATELQALKLRKRLRDFLEECVF